MTNDPQVHSSLSLKSSLPNISNKLHKDHAYTRWQFLFSLFPF